MPGRSPSSSRPTSGSAASAFGGISAYHASKRALEGLSQALAQEVAGFGIHVTLVEPTGFSTDWSGPSSVQSEHNPAYAEFREQVMEMRKQRLGTPGDPEATGPAILKVVDAEEPPLRVFFGVGLLDQIKGEYAKRIENWERWDDVAVASHGLKDQVK